MKIDLNKVANTIKENLNNSISFKTAYYDDDHFASGVFKGTTTILRLYFGYEDKEGNKRMIEKYLSFGVDQDLVVEKAKKAPLKNIPFLIKEIVEERNIRLYRESCSTEVSYSGTKEVSRKSHNPFSLACDNNYNLTEGITDEMVEEFIKPHLTFDLGEDKKPLFLGIVYKVGVDTYFHTGSCGYESIAFIDRECSKAFLTLNAYTCNKTTFSTTSVKDWNNLDLSTFDCQVVTVDKATTNNCTMYGGGFCGRVKMDY